MRADEQHAAAAVTEPRVGVEQVRGAVQGDDGLARCPGRRRRRARRADPARMMASWSAWMVPSTSRIRARPVAAQAGDEGGLVVERGVPLEPVRR